MINLYNEIKENYNDISIDGYYMERFKSLPFKPHVFESKHNDNKELISTLNEQSEELSKAVKNILKKIDSGDYSNESYGMKEVYNSFIRNQNNRTLVNLFASHFSQLAIIADESFVDYEDLTERLNKLLKISKSSFSFMDKMANFIHEYVELEPYIKESMSNPEDLNIYLDELNDLLERNSDIIKKPINL